MRSRVLACALACSALVPFAASAQEAPAEAGRLWALDMIHAEEAWRRGYTGRGVLVGVVDTGAQMDHVDLAANLAPFSLDAFSGGAVLGDPDGHGTHVAGTIGAPANGYGVVGVAFDSRMTILRLLNDEGLIGDNPGPQLEALYDFGVAHGARVFNGSYGGLDVSQLTRAEMVEAIGEGLDAYRNAMDSGAVLVFATGNDTQDHPGVPAGLPVLFPELEGSWLAVTAVGPTGERASYANACGVAMDFCLSAPGGDIDLRGELEDGILSTTPGDALDFNHGTSMAAPHVSGGVAIAMQMFPNASGEEITRLMLATTTDIGAAGIDPIYGWGLLNLRNLAVTLDPESLTLFANTQWAARETQGAVLDTLQGQFERPMGDRRVWAAGVLRSAGHEVVGPSEQADADTAGFLIGADLVLASNFRLGVAGGYASTDVDERLTGNAAELETWSALAYASASHGVLFAEGMLGVSFQDRTYARRFIRGAEGTVLAGLGLAGSAQTDDTSAFGQLRIGVQAPVGIGTVRPFVHGRFTGQHADGFVESGADVFTLAVAGESAVQYEIGPGVQLDVNPLALGGASVAPSFSVAYLRDFGDEEHLVGAAMLGSPIIGGVGDLGEGVLRTTAQAVISGASGRFQAFVRGHYETRTWTRGDAAAISLGARFSF